MGIKFTVLFSIFIMVGNAVADSPMPPRYVYGAIAYRTNYGPSYQIGTAEGYLDAYDAANAARRECGAGCGHFTFYNGCAAIAYTTRGQSSVYGYQTSIQFYNGKDRLQTRRLAEQDAKNRAYGLGHQVVVVHSACS